MTTIGSRLRAAREAAGLSLEQAAVLLACRRRNGNVATAERDLSWDEDDDASDVEEAVLALYLHQHASAYGVRAEWLRTGEGPMRDGQS